MSLYNLELRSAAITGISLTHTSEPRGYVDQAWTGPIHNARVHDYHRIPQICSLLESEKHAEKSMKDCIEREDIECTSLVIFAGM